MQKYVLGDSCTKQAILAINEVRAQRFASRNARWILESLHIRHHETTPLCLVLRFPTQGLPYHRGFCQHHLLSDCPIVLALMSQQSLLHTDSETIGSQAGYCQALHMQISSATSFSGGFGRLIFVRVDPPTRSHTKRQNIDHRFWEPDTKPR